MKKYSVTIRAVGYRTGDLSASHAFHVDAETPAQAMKQALLAYPAQALKKDKTTSGATWTEDWVTPLPDDVEQIINVSLIVGLDIHKPVEIQ